MGKGQGSRILNINKLFHYSFGRAVTSGSTQGSCDKEDTEKGIMFDALRRKSNNM